MTADAARRLYRPPWRIDLTIRAGVRLPIAGSRLADAIAAAATAAGAPPPASIGLILTGDRELAALNRAALGHRGPTDVLSFPLLPPTAFPGHAGRAAVSVGRTSPHFVLPPGARPSLGDVVVSVARATEQAAVGRGGQDGRRRWSTADELRLLVTHGTLHLCGWDHLDAIEGAAMRRLERQLLGLSQADATGGRR